MLKNLSVLADAIEKLMKDKTFREELGKKGRLRVTRNLGMKIKEIDWDNVEEICRFDNIAQETGTIFNSIDWLRIFRDKVILFGIYNENHELIGGFSLFKEQRFGLNIFRNPYFTPNIGIFIKYPINLKYVSKLSVDKEILQNVAKFIDKLNYHIISFSLNNKIIDTQPFIWSKFKVIPRYTYIIYLEKGEDEIWNNISSTRRNDIRKAIKDGLIVEQNFDAGIVENLVNKTFERQDKDFNSYYLREILYEFANDKNSFSFVTFKNETPISVAFCIYDKNTAYYLLGGYNYKNKHHGAGALCLWECIRYAKKLGLKEFDFEGSMVPQIEMYFREFGGELIPYYSINKARLFIETLLKFIKREVF